MPFVSSILYHKKSSIQFNSKKEKQSIENVERENIVTCKYIKKRI